MRTQIYGFYQSQEARSGVMIAVHHVYLLRLRGTWPTVQMSSYFFEGPYCSVKRRLERSQCKHMQGDQQLCAVGFLSRLLVCDGGKILFGAQK